MIDVEYNREKVEEGKRLGCSWIVEEWDQSAWVIYTKDFQSETNCHFSVLWLNLQAIYSTKKHFDG